MVVTIKSVLAAPIVIHFLLPDVVALCVLAFDGGQAPAESLTLASIDCEVWHKSSG